MNKNVFIASSIEAVSAELATICERNGANTTRLQDIYSITEEMLKAKPDALFIEFSLLQGEHKQLLSELRDQDELSDLFIVVYAPEGVNQGLKAAEGANTFVRLPLNDTKTAELFKRAFNLPRQALLILRKPKSQLALALETMGYAVKTLKDAEEALSNRWTEIPDFIIAEYHLQESMVLTLRKS